MDLNFGGWLWWWWMLCHHPATKGKIRQIKGRKRMPTNLSVVAGTTGKFLVTWNGAMLPGAPVTWTSSDPTILPVNDPSDPTGNTADVAVPATDTAADFVLTATGTASDNATVAAKVTVVITQPVVAATGGIITQLS